jgi:hypothetical protein
MLISAQKWKTKRMRKRWIAERRLERRDAVGGIVVVRVGCPEWPPGAEEWRCPFVIEGLGDDSVRYGRRIDSMAALLNALRGIRCKLVQSGVPLRWEAKASKEKAEPTAPAPTPQAQASKAPPGPDRVRFRFRSRLRLRSRLRKPPLRARLPPSSLHSSLRPAS